MSLNIGKRDVQRLADVLDADYESVEDAARAALTEAFAIYESKAKFTVVGQLYYSPDGGWVTPDDAAATKVALGRYGTEKAAMSDAESMTISSATGEQFRAWVLPVHHGTPFSYFTGRKDAKKALATVEVSQADRLSQAMREQLGWATDEELAESAAEVCPECGLEIDPERDSLTDGREATNERSAA